MDIYVELLTNPINFRFLDPSKLTDNPVPASFTQSNKPRLPYETRLVLRALIIGLPGLVALCIVLWLSDIAASVTLTILGLVSITWLVLAFAVQRAVVFHLNTMANLLEALREGDYSLRGRRAKQADALGQVFVEINALSETLQRQRFEAQEATTLLQKIITEIDIAVIAFDDDYQIRLANPAAAQLLGYRKAEQLHNLTADSLGLTNFIKTPGRNIVAWKFATGPGRWDVWSSGFRQGGLPHRLLVISDLSRALRDEERRAWRSLVRVIGHELNNTLTPIKSLADVLQNRIRKAQLAESEEIEDGLTVIANRADSLHRFMSAYTMLAKLPDPKHREVDLEKLMSRVTAMDKRLDVVMQGEALTIQADPDQLEQVMINLIKNGIDAAGADGVVTVSWHAAKNNAIIEVVDNGTGPVNSENLFVPFFTTKPEGTGIGLALSRQIVEAHGGYLSLTARPGKQGAVARLELPLS